MNKQKGVSTILGIIILLVVGGGAYYFISEQELEDHNIIEVNDLVSNSFENSSLGDDDQKTDTPPESATNLTKEKFIVPESASLYLRTTFDEDSKPILHLSVYAGDGCDKVSDLNIFKSKKEGTMFVTVEGYSIQEYQGEGVCPAVVVEAVAEVDMVEFLELGGTQVWLEMNGVESGYSVFQDEYAIYLEPIKVGNIISHELGINKPLEPQSVALITNSDKFAVLGLSGTYRSDVVYTEYLRNIAQDNNLIPVDEVLRGFPQDDDSLWVLADDSQIPNTVPAIIGEITYDSDDWGMESVNVSITRKQPTLQYSF